MICSQMHPVVRMSSVDHQLERGLCRRVAFEYAIGLVGPVDFAARQIPAETSGVAQSLRLGQIHLAPAQRLLGLLAFGSFRASRSARCTEGTSLDSRVFRT